MIRKLEYGVAPETTLNIPAEFSDRLGDRGCPVCAHDIQSQQGREDCTNCLFTDEQQDHCQKQIEASEQIINLDGFKPGEQDAGCCSYQENDQSFPGVPANHKDEEQG